MADSTDFLKQQLHTLRQTARYLLQQAAAHGGEVHLPADRRHSLDDTRRTIAACKAELRAHGVVVDDEPEDGASHAAQSGPAHQPSLVPQIAVTNNDSGGNQGMQGVVYGSVAI